MFDCSFILCSSFILFFNLVVLNCYLYINTFHSFTFFFLAILLSMRFFVVVYFLKSIFSTIYLQRFALLYIQLYTILFIFIYRHIICNPKHLVLAMSSRLDE